MSLLYRIAGLLGISDKGSLRGRVVSGSAGSFLIMVTNVGLSVVTGLLLARILGALNYGVYAYAGSLTGILGLVAHLGINNLIVREVAAGTGQGAWGRVRGLLIWADRAVATVSILLAVTAVTVAWLVRDRFVPLAVLTFVLSVSTLPFVSLTVVRRAAVRGLGKVVRSQIPESVVKPALFNLLVIAAYFVLGRGISASQAMGLRVILSVVVFALAVWILRRSLPQQVKSATPEFDRVVWIRSALPFAIVSGMYTINAQADLAILGSMMPPDQVGVYAVSQRFAQMLVFLLTAVQFTLAPHVARLHAAGEKDRLQSLLTRTTRGVLLLSAPIALTFFLFGRPLLSIMGEEYAAGYPILRVLCVAQLIKVVFGPVGMVAVMTGHEKASAAILAVVASTNIVLNIVLIPIYGPLGAAYATAFSALAWNISIYFLVRRRTQLRCFVLAGQRLHSMRD